MTHDMEIEIRPLEPEMAEVLPRLNEEWYPPGLFPLTIVSCPGYPCYVRRLLAVPSAEREALFTAALSRGELVGYAEWRPMRERDLLFLSTIAVTRAARSAGVGRRLHDAVIEHARREGYARFELDVFGVNEKAQAWYDRLGFRAMHTTLWATGPSPSSREDDGSPEQPVCFRDFPVAEAAHEAYGFSTFRARTARSELTVGRIRDEYFRLTDERALEDPDLLRALGRLDPKRRLLCLVPAATRLPEGFEVLATATRMEMPVPS